jgi:F-type H+-transporting ATPase subunit b
MDETLRQLGELLLGAIPTVVFMLATFAAYSVLVHKSLVRVLAERRSKTEGAVEKARADIAAAEGRTAEYEQRLREARAVVFKSQEARRQKSLQARAAVVAEARARAQAEVESARSAIEEEKKRAQAALQADAASLATEIIRTILQPAGTGAGDD